MAAVRAKMYIGNDCNFYFSLFSPHSGWFSQYKDRNWLLPKNHTKVISMLRLPGNHSSVLTNIHRKYFIFSPFAANISSYFVLMSKHSSRKSDAYRSFVNFKSVMSVLL